MQSWVSYKRQKDLKELHESRRIAEKFPLVTEQSEQQNEIQPSLPIHCNTDPSCDSENSSIDSVPSSAPSSPVQLALPEIRSPDENGNILSPHRTKNGVWDTTPAFCPMKEVQANEIQYGRHLHFSNVKRVESGNVLSMTQSASICNSFAIPSLSI